MLTRAVEGLVLFAVDIATHSVIFIISQGNFMSTPEIKKTCRCFIGLSSSILSILQFIRPDLAPQHLALHLIRSTGSGKSLGSWWMTTLGSLYSLHSIENVSFW